MTAGSGKQLFDELLTEVEKRILARLKKYRPDLTKSTGVVPPRNTPSSTTTTRGGIVLARDLGGTAAAPLVVGLQGRNLASTAPTNGQAVVWNAAGSTWEPGDVTPSGSGYATTIGDTTTTVFTITHNLGTRDVLVAVHKAASTYDYVQPDIAATTTNTITVTFATAPGTNEYRVIVGTGGGVTGGGYIDPLTTRGDLVVRDASNTTRLAIGSANRLLRSNGTDPSWGQVVEADLNLTDVTTANVSTSAHGFVPKAPNDTTKFLRGDGTFAVPTGGLSIPQVVQAKFDAAQLTGITLPVTPVAGHSIILFADSTTGQISSVAATNVTWTQVKTHSSAGAYYAIWVGVVGSSPSGTITWSKPGTYCTAIALEVTDALTPTLGENATAFQAASFGTTNAVTAGRLVVMGYGPEDTAQLVVGDMTIPHVGLAAGRSGLIVGYSRGDRVYGMFINVAGGGIIAEIT